MTSLKKIFIVDDDEGILEVMRIILEDKGYLVMTVANAVGLENKIKKHLPDLIFLDIWMSGMDGREIAKKLKLQKETKNIPIIVITALNDGKKIAKEASADGFLAKPFNIDDLVVMVEKYTTN